MIINEALDDLIDTIKESDIYKNYNHILDQVEKSKSISVVVGDIKKIQKKIVKEKYVYGKNTLELENTLEEKKANLYRIPLYQDYIEISEELNELIRNVNNRLQTCVNSLDI